MVRALPERDIEIMHDFAGRLRQSNKLESAELSAQDWRHVHTVSLDKNYNDDIKFALKSAINTLQFDL